MKLCILIFMLLSVFIGCTSEDEVEVVSDIPIVLANEGGIVISKDMEDNLTLRNSLGHPIVVRCEYTIIAISMVSANRYYTKTRWLKTISPLRSVTIASLVNGDTITISNKQGHPSAIFIVSF